MGEVANYKRPVVARRYPSGGCPIVDSGEQDKCGETQGLEIIREFDKMYQDKMSEIDVSAGGDSLQAKVSLQEDWINDLTAQNKMLAKVIEELEIEAIDRVKHLENKLKNASKSLGEVDSEALKDKDKKIKELEEALKALPIAGDLKKKSEENAGLKQNMDDIRSAFTEEIANKHDIISLLRLEIYSLENKNDEVEKAAFLKDDIIKELRKEIIKLKHKISKDNEMFKPNVTGTAEKGVNTTLTEFQTINHSTMAQVSNNAAVIFIHGEENDDSMDPRSKFDSSDSSECGLSEHMIPLTNGIVHSCRSENDIKRIDWIKPTKERSKLTKTHKKDGGDHWTVEQNSRKISVPKHIPVKTYVNNIEYIKDVD